MIWQAGKHRVQFPRRPMVMGIVNINDDSFCGDGTLDPAAALQQAREQLLAGADIIDIGAESARTNRGPISEEEEVARLRPFIEAWPSLIQSLPAPPWDEQQCWPPLLSINTWRCAVMEQILPLGVDLINDLSALPEARPAQLCAQHGASLLIMHSKGQPKVAHTHVQYPDIMAELDDFFQSGLQLAAQAGLAPEQIILDPGIDFAKQREDNLRIFANAQRLQRWGRPVLMPVSRKTVIGEVLNLPKATERDAGTLACIAWSIPQGAQIFRVHNVAAAAAAIKVLWALQACAAE